jgi:hypothetical protein
MAECLAASELITVKMVVPTDGSLLLMVVDVKKKDGLFNTRSKILIRQKISVAKV